MVGGEQARLLLAFASALLIGAIVGLIVPLSNTVLLYTVLWIALYPVARATFLRRMPHWRYWAGLPIGLIALVVVRRISTGAPPSWFTLIVVVSVTLLAMWRARKKHASGNRT